jgi:hypothetical protein
MKRLVVILPLALAACGGQTTVSTGDTVGCASALFAAGIASPAALLPIALATPACAALASEVIQSIIADVSKRQYARGIRR